VTDWHIITGEYPPQPGGVSDYTRRVALGLVEAGDRVDVFAPPTDQSERADPGVTVHRLPDRFGPRSLRMLSRELDRHPAPRRLLIQYVPHAFGWKAANVPFCLWLQSRRRDSVWVMFHEIAFPFARRQPVSHNALALVNNVMASIVASAAERAFVSIPGWRRMVQPMIDAGKPVDWLPVPSSIPIVRDPAITARLRARYAGTRPLVGNFGTNGRPICGMLHTSVPALIRETDCDVLLMGRHSEELCRALIAQHPYLGRRVHSTGVLPEDDVSLYVAACDVMLQPYPDGVSSRRTSAMVALSHGLPMVTTSGWLTEPLWDESDAVELVPADEPEALADRVAQLIASPARRSVLAARSRALYVSHFDMPHSIRVLRDADRESRPLTMVRA